MIEEELNEMRRAAETVAPILGQAIGRDYRKELWTAIYVQQMAEEPPTERAARRAAQFAAHSLQLFDLTFETGADTSHFTAQRPTVVVDNVDTRPVYRTNQPQTTED